MAEEALRNYDLHIKIRYSRSSLLPSIKTVPHSPDIQYNEGRAESSNFSGEGPNPLAGLGPARKRASDLSRASKPSKVQGSSYLLGVLA